MTPLGTRLEQNKMREEIETRRPRVPAPSEVVLICPDPDYRRVLTKMLGAQQARIVEELGLYPAYNHLLGVIDTDCDAYVIEIDTDTPAAMNLVEAICDKKPSATVMVYSCLQRPELLVNSMRAGAREFLTGAIPPNTLNDALLRASARRAEAFEKKVRGKTMAFWGGKGGCGTTTLAVNFALALRQETRGEVALLDLNMNLGDVATLLGITPRFSLADAIAAPERLDQEFVATLMTKHSSGVSVLAAPDVYTSVPVTAGTIGKLIDLVAVQFPYVVVDAGPSLGAAVSALFQMASATYLITQTDIPGLRSSQRFLNYLQTFGNPDVELVVNRFESRKSQIDDAQIAKTLGISPKYKVPNDYAAARRAADTGNPLASEKGPITECLRRMARVASGKPAEEPKKRGLFS